MFSELFCRKYSHFLQKVDYFVPRKGYPCAKIGTIFRCFHVAFFFVFAREILRRNRILRVRITGWFFTSKSRERTEHIANIRSAVFHSHDQRKKGGQRVEIQTLAAVFM